LIHFVPDDIDDEIKNEYQCHIDDNEQVTCLMLAKLQR